MSFLELAMVSKFGTNILKFTLIAKAIIFYKSHFLSGYLRKPTSQKPTSTKLEVGFLSGFSKVGFVENYGLKPITVINKR